MTGQARLYNTPRKMLLLLLLQSYNRKGSPDVRGSTFSVFGASLRRVVQLHYVRFALHNAWTCVLRKRRSSVPLRLVTISLVSTFVSNGRTSPVFCELHSTAQNRFSDLGLNVC